MSTKNPNIATIFNDHFTEFINDISNVYPKMLIKIWINYVATPYKTQIERGDISFFLEKDYTIDLSGYAQSDNIMEYIHMLREPIQNMGQENQAKAMKYIQNLSKISAML